MVSLVHVRADQDDIGGFDHGQHLKHTGFGHAVLSVPRSSDERAAHADLHSPEIALRIPVPRHIAFRRHARLSEAGTCVDRLDAERDIVAALDQTVLKAYGP